MKRFRETETGYRFDKLIFFIVFIAIVSLVLKVMYDNAFDFNPHPYFKCSRPFCENPFYKEAISKEGQLIDCKQRLNILWVIPIYTTKDCREGCDWCNNKYLEMGEYGTTPKSSFLLNNMLWISILIILLGLLNNHLFHNRGKKFDIEIVITEKIKINRRTIGEWIEKNKNNNIE